MKYNILRLGSIGFGSFVLLSMTLIRMNPQDSWVAPAEYQNMKNPYAGIDDKEKIGRIIYSKQCKFCHGSKGKGDGNQANLVETPVADLTVASVKDQTDGSLYYKIVTGRDDMPTFEKIITDGEDLWLVINYIRSLGK